jgi:cytidylate kinase
MWKNIGVEKCLSFINCQLRPGSTGGPPKPAIKPAVTISRMTGAGGRTVAAKLAEYLQTHAPGPVEWTVFDRNLMEKVLVDHHLPERIAEYLPENHKPYLGDTVEEFLGLHPSSWALVQQTTDTVWHLAQMGYVILVGRGAAVITAKLPNVFHVRLIGSLEARLEQVQQIYHLDRPAALEMIKTEDRGRRRYLKQHFGKDIDDPMLYDLVINTDRISHGEAARLIGDAVVHQLQLEPHGQPVVH